MSNEREPQEVDMKMFIKAVNEQFRKLNTRLDDLLSPSMSKTTRRYVFEEKEEDDLDLEESSSMSVEDYYKEMEIAMIRANTEKDRKATMVIFFAGLNKEITDVVDLQHYVEIEEVLHKIIRVKKKIKSKGFKSGSVSSSSWKSN
ncbi:Retrovirus-related Pol polyprotein from transposon 17.6 [Melia azedarach]|uniref:Retrovirus-related Pol polyprotein from transposon 17.6 n=1 Tax=Melia azedarach TaxID=155640 RepID=A0ACC1XH76_MELAZ|nr:Retrovirus-related Pol polyprotein from transposon 17.6 [Melia azedarach]